MTSISSTVALGHVVVDGGQQTSAQDCTTHPVCTRFCPPSWDPSISDYECTVKRQYCNLATRLELADSLSLAVKSMRHSRGSFIFPGA
ncbi:hypothetical protein C1H46_022839 [Malus baccata]|uniref:Uncharacterized protein n=1 Tax=Malus baccata TaxID=106549 RepID=A0A540LYK3_MALBA|nr:hypothetical protein C1H46_022839 [Malus baccata]